jgi:hypothetical protein
MEASGRADTTAVKKINCEECNEPMVRVLGEETVTTLEGETIVFRRTSDYLLCKSCLKLFSVVEMREKNRITHVGEVPDVNYFSVLKDENAYRPAATNGGEVSQHRRRSNDRSLSNDEVEN